MILSLHWVVFSGLGLEHGFGQAKKFHPWSGCLPSNSNVVPRNYAQLKSHSHYCVFRVHLRQPVVLLHLVSISLNGPQILIRIFSKYGPSSAFFIVYFRSFQTNIKQFLLISSYILKPFSINAFEPSAEINEIIEQKKSFRLELLGVGHHFVSPFKVQHP